MEYLYHYTSLSSLALILKSKKLRFNSLINMDDAEEVKTKNSEYLGKYCFISSWTDLEEENIPFWDCIQIICLVLELRCRSIHLD